MLNIDFRLSSEARFIRILAKAREGNSRAMEKLMKLPRGHLLLMAGRQIPTRRRVLVDPRDAVQETLMCAHQSFPHFRGRFRREFFGWMQTILANTVCDLLRAAQCKRRGNGQRRRSLDDLVADEWLDPCHEGGRSACDATISRETAAAVRRCMEQLPTRYRQVLELHYLDGQPLKEIAAKLGINTEAVAQLAVRARRELKRLLREYSVIDDDTFERAK